MARYGFSVHYDGSGLEDHRIPISDLAPSLLALSTTFQEIQSLVNPDEPALSLDIVANEKGSFIVDLLLANGPDILSKVIDFLNSDGSNAIGNLINYTTIFLGVIGLTKKLANKKIKNKRKAGNGQIKITLEDGTTIEISKDVLDAYLNVNVRKGIKDSVKPLEKDGIDKIDFYHDKNQKETVNKDEYKDFSVPELKTKELETVDSNVFLQIVNVAFEHGKWKFSDGSNQFFAKIEDEDFLTSVEKNQQQFGSTDTLKVKLRTRQYIDPEGSLRKENTIVKVLKHVKGAQQLELDFEDKLDKDDQQK